MLFIIISSRSSKIDPFSQLKHHIVYLINFTLPPRISVSFSKIPVVYIKRCMLKGAVKFQGLSKLANANINHAC